MNTKTVTLVFFIALFFASCGNTNTDKRLSKHILENVQLAHQQNALQFDFSTIQEFNWENMLIITPYMPDEQLEDILKNEASKLKHLRMHERDDIHALVFLHKKKIVKLAQLATVDCNFANIPANLIDRKEAVFNLVEENGYLKLIHQ